MNKILRMLTFTFSLICITNYASGMSTFRSFGWLEGLSKTERCDKLKDMSWLYKLEYFLELNEEKFNREPESALEITKDHVWYIRSQMVSWRSATVEEQLDTRLTETLIYIDKFELFIPTVREQIKKLILEIKGSVYDLPAAFSIDRIYPIDDDLPLSKEKRIDKLRNCMQLSRKSNGMDALFNYYGFMSFLYSREQEFNQNQELALEVTRDQLQYIYSLLKLKKLEIGKF